MTDQSAIRSTDVAFDSAGATLMGTLHIPDGPDGQTYPGVIVTGAWTTVKEQMPATYAQELAKRGYAALVFDFRGWGASEGEPRYLEDPVAKTEDIQAAARFMASNEAHALGVADEKLSGVGVCASSGYMADAVASDARFGKLAMIAAWVHDPALAEQIYGGPESTAGLIEAGKKAAAADEPQIITAASTTDSASLMYQVPYYTEEDRGLIPAYDNKFNVASWEPWLTYDALSIAERLDKPTLIVCSDAAALPQGAHAFADRMKSRPEELWLENVTQFDFYDRPETVETSANAVAAFLAK